MTPSPRHPVRRILAVLISMSIALPSLATPSAGPEAQAAISTLGNLNGVALACGQMALSTRLRDILINEAPKERDVGELFEQATQASFLAHGQGDAICPESKILAEKIDTARNSMRNALGSGR